MNDDSVAAMANNLLRILSQADDVLDDAQSFLRADDTCRANDQDDNDPCPPGIIGVLQCCVRRAIVVRDRAYDVAETLGAPTDHVGDVESMVGAIPAGIPKEETAKAEPVKGRRRR